MWPHRTETCLLRKSIFLVLYPACFSIRGKVHIRCELFGQSKCGKANQKPIRSSHLNNAGCYSAECGESEKCATVNGRNLRTKVEIAPSVGLAGRDGKVHRGQDRETEGGRERVNKDRIRSGLKAMVKARRDIRAGNTDMFGTMVRTKDEEKRKSDSGEEAEGEGRETECRK